MIGALQHVWEALSAVTPPPDTLQTAVALSGGAALVAQNTVWRLSRHGLTLVHEASHALIGLGTGRRVVSIKLHGNSSGLTTTSGKATGIGRFLTTLAGYPGPGLAGVGVAALAGAGRPALALALVAVAFALVTLLSRNLWGLLVAGTATALSYGSIAYGGGSAALGLVAIMLAGYLATGGLRCAIDLASIHRHRGQPAEPEPARGRRGTQRAATEQVEGTDADSLAAMTPLPAGAWVGLFGLGSAVCCWAVVSALLSVPGPGFTLH